MNIFKSLFTKKRKNKQLTDTCEFEDYLKSKATKAIHLAHTESLISFSKIGGVPDLAYGFEWPVWNDKPMSFLGQIDLSSLPRIPGLEALPAVGMLYFFYDQEQGTWGFDPKDLGSWKVHFAANTDALRPLNPPPGLPPESTFREIPLHPSVRDTYPTFERLGLVGSVDSVNLFEIDDRLRALVRPDGPEHQVGGFPNPVQSDSMELEAQLVSNGLYCGDSTGYDDPRADALSPGSQEWRLLLQIDTDESADMMWGDSGMLYFWIRKSDLECCNFSHVWMILQCC